MQSPHKYIGTDEAGNRKGRTDLLLLDALSHCKEPVSTNALIEIADPRDFLRMKNEQVIFILTSMIADGFVDRSESAAFFGDRLRWQITEKGRAHLVACEAQDVFADCEHYAAVKPANLRIEEAPESYSPGPDPLNARLRAAHADLDSRGVAPAKPRDPFQVSVCNAQEPKAPAFARITVHEDELDDWWEALDVDAKAAAFCEYSLTARIVGDLKPETVAALRNTAAAAYECVTGGD